MPHLAHIVARDVVKLHTIIISEPKMKAKVKSKEKNTPHPAMTTNLQVTGIRACAHHDATAPRTHEGTANGGTPGTGVNTGISLALGTFGIAPSANSGANMNHSHAATTAGSFLAHALPTAGVYHDFELKMHSTEFRGLLKKYDLIFFAETDLRAGEDDRISVLRGFTLVSLPGKPWLSRSRCAGGVVLLIRDTIHFEKSVLSSPDILVLDMGSMWIVGAYIPPSTSRWQGWTDTTPLQKLWETATLCTQNEDNHNMVVFGSDSDIESQFAFVYGTC
ncbi:hypothetical protein C8F01DRAFT_1088328 [Mycena amicta]|nr:hypothetical protein C8F01DRAFT_1088328 [Mycena amicta]